MAHEITIYGQTYQLTDGMENYAKVRTEFEILSEKYEKQYKKEMETKGFNAETLVRNAHDVVNTYFEKAGAVILERLAQNGIYTVRNQDIASLAEECGVLEAFNKEFSAIENMYYKIVEKAEEEKLQRELRKESRGRFVGGGFGLKGAIRGTIQAELLNQVTGLGHSAFNSFGNARTEREKKEQLRSLYFLADASLRNAFKTTISNYYVVMLAVLDEYDIITFDWPTEEHEGQAKAILENLAANRIPKDKIDSVLFQLVTLDPFNMDTYSYILNKHGDSENELEKFGEAHGINIRSLKKGIIDSSFYSDITKACENFEEEKDPVQFENKLVSIQSKIDKKKKKMGLTTESECDKMIKKEMKGLGAKYKTVDGVVFQTMEEAKAARKDLKKFYEYLSIHGIESESVCEDIKKIEFKTDIVTANLEKRLEEMKILTNERELGKRIEKVFKGNGFSVASTNNDSLFSEKVFVIGVSKDFTANANRVRKLAGISDKEKIVLMFKNEKQHEDVFFWWVLSNDNLYTFENDDDNVENKKVVPFLDIEFIHADRNGNLVTRIRGEIDRTDTLELSNECEKDSVRENLSKAMEEIRYLIAPLTMGRSASKKTDRKMDVASLDVKKLANNDSWRAAVASCKEVKEHACINDNSPAFKTLLNKAKQYWDCEFEDENVYFVMVDSSIGSSVVLTSARCYIYGKVHSTTQKYVFPIDKISTFRGEGKGKKYLMFFDVDYFKKNYFDCSGGGVCFNTVDFNMFNIPEKTGEYVCRALTSMEKEIRKPMLEKEEKRKYFEKAVTEATDSTKINEVIKVLNNDKILDEDDRKFFLSKLQQKSDKYQNTAANARELEQMVAVIKRDDLAEINSALNKLLKNELYDASDKKAITDLIEIQLEIGSKLYETELSQFFNEKSTAAHLILGKPVYMKKNSKETAGKLCDFFIRISPELEQDEVPLVLFKNSSQFRSVPPSPPDAEECLISNKRLFVSFKGKSYEVFALNDIEINQMLLEHGNRIRGNGKLISFCFPYVKIEEIEDRTYRSSLRGVLGESEHAVVAKELRTFVTAVYKTTVEKVQMEQVFRTLPTDGEALKSLPKEELEKEYSKWEEYAKYGTKITNYLALVEAAIKEIYKKEAGELCAGLSDLSASELKTIKFKLKKKFSYKNFSDCIAEQVNAVDVELTKREDIATREEIAQKTVKLDSYTREELEKEYKIWKAYTGNVAEAKEFLQAVKDVLGKVYKKEVEKECANLEKLTVKGAKDLLNRINKTYINKDCIREEIASVEAAIVAKQDEEIRSWMPENLDSLSEKELEKLLIRYNSGNYESPLYVKYALPMIDKRNMRMIETADKMHSFIESSVSAAVKSSCLRFESKEKILRDINQQTEVDADSLVCTIGTGNDVCKIFTKKFANGKKTFPWEKILLFEAKKKLFGSTLSYQCKDGVSGEISIQVSSSLLPPIADLLNEIVSYMARMRTNQQNSTPSQRDAAMNRTLMLQGAGNVVGAMQGTAGIAQEIEHSMVESAVLQRSKPTVASAGQKEEAKKHEKGEMNLEEEYEALRPLVEPILPTIEAHIAKVKGEFLNYKIMKWDGDPEVIQGEKAPILVVMRDTNCSPRLMGEKAINNAARFVLGILPDYFYIINEEKFILYVKGVKNEWKISNLQGLNFKAGFLSSTLLVTDGFGMQKKIKIADSFQAHVDGINNIIRGIKGNGNKFCSSCGNKLSANDKFCGECGTPVLNR